MKPQARANDTSRACRQRLSRSFDLPPRAGHQQARKELADSAAAHGGRKSRPKRRPSDGGNTDDANASGVAADRDRHRRSEDDSADPHAAVALLGCATKLLAGKHDNRPLHDEGRRDTCCASRHEQAVLTVGRALRQPWPCVVHDAGRDLRQGPLAAE